jgi:hypothetical protein
MEFQPASFLSNLSPRSSIFTLRLHPLSIHLPRIAKLHTPNPIRKPTAKSPKRDEATTRQNTVSAAPLYYAFHSASPCASSGASSCTYYHIVVHPVPALPYGVYSSKTITRSNERLTEPAGKKASKANSGWLVQCKHKR